MKKEKKQDKKKKKRTSGLGLLLAVLVWLHCSWITLWRAKEQTKGSGFLLFALTGPIPTSAFFSLVSNLATDTTGATGQFGNSLVPLVDIFRRRRTPPHHQPACSSSPFFFPLAGFFPLHPPTSSPIILVTQRPGLIFSLVWPILAVFLPAAVFQFSTITPAKSPIIPPHLPPPLMVTTALVDA